MRLASSQLLTLALVRLQQLLLLLLHRDALCATSLNQVTFDLVEEQPAGTLVGSLDDRIPSTPPDGASMSHSFGLIPNKGERSSGADHLELDALGNLRVKRPIDRDLIDRCDKQHPCQLAVQAFRFGGGTSSAAPLVTIDVRVNVLDINDNSPTWSRHALEVVLNEDHPVGEPFKVEAAKDPDFGLNGTVAYELLDPTDTFALVDRVGGGTYQQESETFNVVLKRPLDRETVEKYNITVIARDLADVPRSSSVQLIVKVDDLNDNKPIFNQSHYSASISETTLNGVIILQLHATDADKGRNGEVEYSFADGAPYQVRTYFALDRVQGQLSLRQALDYDGAGTRRFEFGVAARDRALIPRSSVAQVVINVLDENDCSPVFTVYQFSQQHGMRDMRETNRLVLPENAEPQSLLGIASVNDNDSGPGGEAECDIQDPMSSLFKLNQLPEKMDSKQKTYQIVSLERFDREVQETYQVVVLCQDRGSPPLSISYTMHVDIQDINDEKPAFTLSRYEFSVKENLPALSHVGRVQATDRDAMQNGQVSYEMDSTSPDARLFRVTANGEVQTTAPLDRENKQLLKFTAIVKDHGNPSLNGSASVVVRVLDDNDAEPRFGQASYAFEVFENEAPDSVVGNLTAWDDDIGNNAKLTFTIVPLGAPAIPFRVVTLYEGFAQIRTTSVIDRESDRTPNTEEKSYIFSVRATDRGVRPHAGNCMVKVVIRDRNDNIPKWIVPSSQLRSVNISRDADVGRAFIHLRAIDPDEGESGRIRYSVRDGDAEELFALDPNDGGLQLRRQPHHTGRYALNVVATDCVGCNVSHSAYAVLMISVIDQTKDARSERRGDGPGGKLSGEFSNERIVVWLVSCTAGIALLTISGILVARCLLVRLARADTAAPTAGKRSQQQQQQQQRTEAEDTPDNRLRESLLFAHQSMARDRLLKAATIPRDPSDFCPTDCVSDSGGGSGGGGGGGGVCIDGSCDASKLLCGSNAYQGAVTTLSNRTWHPGGLLIHQGQHTPHRLSQLPQMQQVYTTLATNRRQQLQHHQQHHQQHVASPQYSGIFTAAASEASSSSPRASAAVCHQQQQQQPLAALGLRAHEDPQGDCRSAHLTYQASSFV